MLERDVVQLVDRGEAGLVNSPSPLLGGLRQVGRTTARCCLIAWLGERLALPHDSLTVSILRRTTPVRAGAGEFLVPPSDAPISRHEPSASQMREA
jgi:hypothetical protein